VSVGVVSQKLNNGRTQVALVGSEPTGPTTRRCASDTALRTLGFGHWASGTGVWTLRFGHGALGTGLPTLDHGSRRLPVRPEPGTVPAVRARAPASTANLGPGFDVLALALGWYVEVEVVPASSLRIESSGEGADLPRDAGHLAARVASSVVGHDRLAITVRSEIPVARGLGSSAALAAATAAAAGAADPFKVAVEVDGHPENAAASVLGGLVAATVVGGRPRAVPLALDPGLAFVCLVPDRSLSTAEARRVLPSSVPRQDAVFNLGRLALLVAGLADRRLLAPEAAEDRLHQAQRSQLFPEAPALIDALLDGGARAACWSGAGPTLLAVCDREQVEAVRRAGAQALEGMGVAGRAVELPADRQGLCLADASGRWQPFGGS